MERLTFGVADAKFESGVFSGRVHAYGASTVDGRGHAFQPGIFQPSIASGKVRAYWGHSVLTATGTLQNTQRLGSQKAGTLQLVDTGQTVDFAIKPPNTSYAADLKALVDAGEEVGVSFEFYAEKYERRDGLKLYTAGRLAQINFVEDPAFQGTSVILNSAEEGESAISVTTKIRARRLAGM